MAEAISPADLALLQRWQGRSACAHDCLVPAPLQGLSATLDRDDPEPRPGSDVPPLWHWLYFTPLARQGEIGPDGHPKRGGFLPPVPLPDACGPADGSSSTIRYTWASRSRASRAWPT